jgi:hypothetical protein
MSAHDPRTAAEQDDPVKLPAHIEMIEDAETLAVAVNEAGRALYL